MFNTNILLEITSFFIVTGWIIQSGVISFVKKPEKLVLSVPGLIFIFIGQSIYILYGLLIKDEILLSFKITTTCLIFFCLSKVIVLRYNLLCYKLPVVPDDIYDI